jgi:hypothetical protein
MATASSSKFPKLPKTKGLKMTPLSLHLTKNLEFFLLTAFDKRSSSKMINLLQKSDLGSAVYHPRMLFTHYELVL